MKLLLKTFISTALAISTPYAMISNDNSTAESSSNKRKEMDDFENNKNSKKIKQSESYTLNHLPLDMINEIGSYLDNLSKKNNDLLNLKHALKDTDLSENIELRYDILNPIYSLPHFRNVLSLNQKNCFINLRLTQWNNNNNVNIFFQDYLDKEIKSLTVLDLSGCDLSDRGAAFAQFIQKNLILKE